MTVLAPQHLEKAMQAACAEARKWLGATSPNPPVGAAALDATGNVLAVAAHQRAGTEHAEARLLRQCREQGILGQIHTLAVTLEPCNHHGRTPPCAEAIIAAGIRHVAIGARDPNPHVKGGGIERLRAAGIDVMDNIAANECHALIHAFAYHAKTGKPWVTVKQAFDRQGSMIPPPGQKTFTSLESLTMAHRLRKKCDALVTGSGTILADNPLFTVRHVQDHKDKRRFLAILDRRGRVPADYVAMATKRGFDVLIYRDMGAAFADLTGKGAQDILVEAGPTLSQAVLDSSSWTMRIAFHQNETGEQTKITFNPLATTSFSPQIHNLDWFLPEQ
jgi:diaminohydroxyphosphoribosylaminopyrimidine deaminase/5-amino-6-(5-phosphoribosylamino)uracil reductase